MTPQGYTRSHERNRVGAETKERKQKENCARTRTDQAYVLTFPEFMYKTSEGQNNQAVTDTVPTEVDNQGTTNIATNKPGSNSIIVP